MLTFGNLQYGVVLDALFDVPAYMMQNRLFGYRETRFIISSNEDPICVGTVTKPPASKIKRRSLV